MLRYRNLIDALDAAPDDNPFITFWIDEDEQETVTFSEFRRRARSQSEGLKAEGVSAGDRVIVIMPQGIAAMTVFVGAMILGAAPAFLAYPNDKVDPSKYRSGLAGVTANLSARLVVIDERFPDALLSHVSLAEETRLLRAGDGSASRKKEAPAIRSEEANQDSRRDADQIALIQHSAGTTGLQKGVALTHAAVLRQLEHLTQALEIDRSTDRIYSWLPLYHDMGLIACFMLPLAYHVPVVMQSPIDWVMQPETMLQAITAHKCTLAWLPNFAFQFVPRRTRPNRRMQYDLSSVRALINCSEPIRSSSMQEFQSAFAPNGLKAGALQTCYAMAENVFAITQSEIHRPSGPALIWADGRQFRSQHRIHPGDRGDTGFRFIYLVGSFVAQSRNSYCVRFRRSSLKRPRWRNSH